MIIVPATSTVALVKFEKAAEVVTTGAKALADVWQFAPSFVDLVRRVYADRVSFYDGAHTLAPGIELVKIGGHTKGLQSVRVHTARGWVVLTSDASHYYENMEKPSPFPIVFHLGEMLAGYDTLRNLADSADHLVPGHDPLVRKIYPFWGDPANDIMALHQPPKARPA